MKKIIEFIKKNWIGALIGFLYMIISAIVYEFDSFSGLSFVFVFPSYTVYWFIAIPFALLGFRVQSYLPTFPSIEAVVFIFATIFFVCFGALIESFIVKGSPKNRLFNMLFKTAIPLIIIFGLVLYSFTVTPPRQLPNRCNMGTEFQCLDYQITAAGAFKLRLKNNVGEPIDVTTLTLNTETVTAFACSTPPAVPISGWKSGEVKELTWSGCNFSEGKFKQGKKAKILIHIKFKTKDGVFRETIGEIFTMVE